VRGEYESGSHDWDQFEQAVNMLLGRYHLAPILRIGQVPDSCELMGAKAARVVASGE
jgi:hypothetical protein